MRRQPDIGAFMAQHSDGRVVGQVPELLGGAVTEAEAEFQRRLLTSGYSTSYLAVLGLAATLTFDAGEYSRGNAKRRTRAMARLSPGPANGAGLPGDARERRQSRQAALLVADHTETLIRCRWSNRPAKGGG